MGPKQLGTWDKVPAPSKMTEGMQSDSTTGSGFAGASRLPSVEMPQREEMAPGGMKSAQTSTKIGRAGSGRSTLQSPPAEPMPHGLQDGGKY